MGVVERNAVGHFFEWDRLFVGVGCPDRERVDGPGFSVFDFAYADGFKAWALDVGASDRECRTHDEYGKERDMSRCSHDPAYARWR